MPRLIPINLKCKLFLLGPSQPGRQTPPVVQEPSFWDRMEREREAMLIKVVPRPLTDDGTAWAPDNAARYPDGASSWHPVVPKLLSGPR
jgi:hypothetical protein